MLIKGHVIPEHHFGAWVDDIGDPDRGTLTQALFHSLKNMPLAFLVLAINICFQKASTCKGCLFYKIKIVVTF